MLKNKSKTIFFLIAFCTVFYVYKYSFFSSIFTENVSHQIIFSGFAFDSEKFSATDKLSIKESAKEYNSLQEVDASWIKNALPPEYYSTLISTIEFRKNQLFSIYFGSRLHVKGLPRLEYIKNLKGSLSYSAYISICENAPKSSVYPFILVVVPKTEGIREQVGPGGFILNTDKHCEE